jgi:prophage antirepressor-like protein
MSKATDASTTMAAVVHRDRFDNHALDVIQYKGRPCWVAREIGTALGYSHGGKRLANKVTGAWADEFVAGHDYEVLDGEDLASFKAVAEEGTESVPSFTSSAVILYESGVHLACIKTDKPAGKRLRRHLVEDVLPKLARGEAIAADPKRAALPDTDYRKTREERLAAREHRLATKARYDAMLRVAEYARAANVDASAIMTIEVRAAEFASGMDLGLLLPNAPVGARNEHWLSATEIGVILGVSAHRVGMTVNALGIRTNKALAVAVLDKSRSSAKTVPGYRYHPDVVGMIRAKLVEDGIAVASAE